MTGNNCMCEHSFNYQMLSLVSLQIILQLGLHFLTKLPVMYTPLSAWNPKRVACLLCSKFGLTKLCSKTLFLLDHCKASKKELLYLDINIY